MKFTRVTTILAKIRPFLKKYGAFIAVILFVGISAARVFSQNGEVQSETVTPSVELMTLAEQKATNRVIATGTIESENQVTIRSEVNAPVDMVYARVGEAVAPGTPIMEFRHDDFDAQVAQAAAGVQTVQAQLAIQTAPPRPEDLRRAELAVTQAQAGLRTALTNQEKTVTANKELIEDTEENVSSLYRGAYLDALSVAAALKESLVTVSDYQALYFSCTNDALCFDIAEAKERAMYEAYGVRYAGRWSSASVQGVQSGIIAELGAMNEQTVDGLKVEDILMREKSALLAAREAVLAVRQGFDAYPSAAGATALDRTAVDGQRAAIDSVLAIIESNINSYTTIQGGVRGDVAASIEEARTTAEQNARIAEASVEVAQATLESAQLTLKTLVEGPRDLDLGPLYAQLAQVNSAYELAASAQRRYFVNAPFAGEIIALHANLGEAIAPGQPIVTIANPDALEISVFVSPEDRRLISRHAAVTVNGVASGVITSIASGIDEATGKVEVKVALVENTATLLVGEQVTVEFETEAEAGVSGAGGMQVPLTAVKTTPEGSFVFTVLNSVIVPVPVTTGAVRGSDIEINFAAQETPEKIIRNVRSVKSGETVIVK